MALNNRSWAWSMTWSQVSTRAVRGGLEHTSRISAIGGNGVKTRFPSFEPRLSATYELCSSAVYAALSDDMGRKGPLSCWPSMIFVKYSSSDDALSKYTERSAIVGVGCGNDILAVVAVQMGHYRIGTLAGMRVGSHQHGRCHAIQVCPWLDAPFLPGRTATTALLGSGLRRARSPFEYPRAELGTIF